MAHVRFVEEEDPCAADEHLEELDTLLRRDAQVADARGRVEVETELRRAVPHLAVRGVHVEHGTAPGFAPEDDVLRDGELRDEQEVLMDEPHAERRGVARSADGRRRLVAPPWKR